jgi:hypothetical protein
MIVVSWALGGSIASACAVCGAAGPNNQAYLDTMVLMTLTPLALIGGVVAVLYVRNRELEKEVSRRAGLD